MKKVELQAEKLPELRRQIILGSLFISDYKNTFGIDPEAVCTFFEGYCEFLEELAKEDGFAIRANNMDEFFKIYDTDDNLREWFYCFEECPLISEVEEDEWEEMFL